MKTRLIALLAIALAAACSGPEAPNGVSTAAAQPAAEPTQTAQVAQTTETAQPAATTTVAQPAPTATAAPAPRVELAQADSASADLAAAGYREGEQYVRLSPVQPTSTGAGQVEVAEFFMYSCIHCYHFEPYVVDWLKTKPAYINFVRIPTVWNPTVRLHAQAFYAAQALGKGEEMQAEFFREMHVARNYMQTREAIQEFFSRFGVSKQDFDNAFDSFSVNTSLRRADELGRRYGVDGTPTIVVNGKYRTNASMAGGYPELLKLVDALAASEKAQM